MVSFLYEYRVTALHNFFKLIPSHTLVFFDDFQLSTVGYLRNNLSWPGLNFRAYTMGTF